jgi:hypothetical protein
MTRTHLKHWRAYVNGYDLSGYSRQIGALSQMFDAETDTAITDEIKNMLIGKGDIQAGPLNAFLDNDTAGLFSLQAQTERNVMFVMGANAAPVAGDPVFAWKFQDTGYMAEPGSGFVAAQLPFGGSSSQGVLSYEKPWGFLLHAKAARTAVNSSTGLDDSGASSALGGIFAYHIHSSNGTVTVKAQHAATNSDGSFADLTLATSGSVNASTTPQHGLIALSSSLTINRYTRWQVVFGTATTVLFSCALIRNTIA